MRMVRMEGGLVLPPGQTIELAPGGRHGMLEGLVQPLAAGTDLDLTLTFAGAGPVDVRARVVRYEDIVR